jgi:UDP-2,3-diacylglucosamine pyrophosphatase LpxH
VDAGLHIGNKFLFDWNEIPGNGSNELIEYLRNTFHVNGLNKQKIHKTDNDMSIKLSGKKNSVILTLNDKKTGVNLIIDNVLKDELNVKLENTKLKIYRKKTFAFIHGQQYDKGQITEPISKKLGIRFDPLDVVQDILNVSIVKSVFREKMPTLIYTALIIILIYSGKIGLDSLTKIIQGPLSLDILPELLVFTGFAFLFSYVVITPLAKLITEIQGPIWKYFFKPRDMTVEEVIKKGYYNERYDNMTVDVVVFGHTHIAGGHYLEKKKRLFINTGAWVAEKERDLNTFAYIDDNGISLLSWLGTKKDGIYAFKRVYLDNIFST